MKCAAQLKEAGKHMGGFVWHRQCDRRQIEKVPPVAQVLCIESALPAPTFLLQSPNDQLIEVVLVAVIQKEERGVLVEHEVLFCSRNTTGETVTQLLYEYRDTLGNLRIVYVRCTQVVHP